MSYNVSSTLGNSSGTNPFTIPKLAADSSNWITCKEWINTVEAARGLKHHLNGTVCPPLPALTFLQPTAPTPEALTAVTAAGPAAEARLMSVAALVALTEKEYLAKIEVGEKKVNDYEQKEATTCQAIYGTITDSLMLQVQELLTAEAVWTVVQVKNKGKSEIHSVTLQTCLMNTKCEEGGDVRAHLDSLLKMHAELVLMDVPILDTDFSAMIYTLLPKSYGTLLTALVTAARVSWMQISYKDVIFSVNKVFN